MLQCLNAPQSTHSTCDAYSGLWLVPSHSGCRCVRLANVWRISSLGLSVGDSVSSDTLPAWSIRSPLVMLYEAMDCARSSVWQCSRVQTQAGSDLVRDPGPLGLSNLKGTFIALGSWDVRLMLYCLCTIIILQVNMYSVLKCVCVFVTQYVVRFITSLLTFSN